MRTMRTLAIATLWSLLTASASGQERPFLFSVSAPPVDSGKTIAVFATSVGDHPFDAVDQEQLLQRVGVQIRVAPRLTVFARAGFAADSRDARSSQDAEFLYGIVEDRAHAGSIAAGGGLRHEPGGTNVLLGRVALGRRLSEWRLDGNALFEKPLSYDRDSLDLITSVGIARKVLPSLHVGVEAIGEDLEGFWEPDEAEGGAKLLIGPSMRIAPSGKSWEVSAAGGPMIRATQSRTLITGDAVRSLPVSTQKNSYAVRVAFGYRF